MSVRWSDGGPFGVIPAWVLEADVSDRAVRAYAILARHAGAEGSTFRGKKELGERLRCARTATDSAISELVEIGALSVEERWAKNGAQLENGYVVHAAPPPRVDGGPPPQERGATRARSLPGEPSTTVEPSKASPAVAIVTRKGWSVDRVPVTEHEEWLARLVLHNWNAIFEQKRSSQDSLRQIVMRIREHPELREEEFSAILTTAHSRPWWKGTPGPSVVFGNGNVFETCIEDARARANGRASPEKPGRYGRGLTTRQILDMTKGR